MFLGTIPRRELVERYRRASIFCLPSRQEGFGIVFLEAMASSKPVVAALAAAIPETVVDGETGILVHPDDPGALAQALLELLSDPERCRSLGEAGRSRVEQYRVDKVALSFLLRVQAGLDGGPESQRRTHPAPDVSVASGRHQADSAGMGALR